MIKKSISLFVIAAILISLFPGAALAASGTISTGGEYDLSLYGNNSTVTINSGLFVMLTNTSGATYTNMQIVCGEGVTLTINGVKIDDSANDLVCGLAFTGNNNKLILTGNSNIKSGLQRPGIKVESGTTLEISGSGSAEVAGGQEAAGIGSGIAGGGTINIIGGDITAAGGAKAAGIGSGSIGSGGTITISGGTVNATGGYKEDGESGAGIGGGSYGSGGQITIKDGRIHAVGGRGAACIGGGSNGYGGTIKIEGGTVEAIGEEASTGIGAGSAAQNGDILITGGTVTARGAGEYAGIGASANSYYGTIVIQGGTINATGGSRSAGIGGGPLCTGGSVVISDGTVNAFGGDKGGAGIGTGSGGTGGTVAVNSGIVKAVGGDRDADDAACKGGAGIGGGERSKNCSVSINGGTVYAQMGEGGLYDIGDTGGTLSIGGYNSAIILKNGLSAVPSTTTHQMYTTNTVSNHMAFGYEIPETWSAPVYAYLNNTSTYELRYDPNEGEGTVPETVRQRQDSTTQIAAGSGLTKGGDIFSKWNTQPNGLGLDYKPGNLYNFSESITLFAIYTVPVHVSSVTLDKENADITDGYMLKLNAAVLPANTTYPDITWTSDNENVAAVDGDGNVTAIYPGTATITALADGISDTCDITVKPKHVTSVTLSSHSETMEEEDTVTLIATVLPENATYPEVTWRSDNESVAAVDQSGCITAVGAGTATVTAAADGVSDSCEIRVDAKNYTVVFDMQYTGAENPTVKVDKNTAVAEPERPTRPGYAFIRWFREPSCINEWDFSNAVTDDITLYALWKKDGTVFSGCGTQINPYRITSAGELAGLSMLVNAGNTDYRDKCYIQTQDIDLSAYANWTPVGTNVTDNMFAGSYDGNGNSITNLNITNGSGYTGLFGYVSGAVKNLTVENGRISINSENATVGTIAGCVFNGSIQNCNVQTSSINASDGVTLYIGGITGSVTASVISGCSFKGTISIAGFGVHSGGITGYISSSSTAGPVIKDCISAGSIYADMTSYSYIGGIAGRTNINVSRSSIERCSNSLVIQAQGNINCYCGGILGSCENADISDCYNTANIISGPQKAGHGAGGLAGYYFGSNSTIENCYNTGGVQGYYCGGIAGYNNDSFAAITNCYYVDTCSLAVGGGAGTANPRSSDELKLQSTYSGLDFSSVWTLDEAEETGYPYPQLKGRLFYMQPHEVKLTADDTMESLQGSGAYQPFETVTITALPKEHYTFKNWAVSSGGALIDNPSSSSATFSMPTWDVSITAISEKKKYNLAFEYDGSGTASAGGAYAWGDTVSITAGGTGGDQFLYWDVISGGAEISDKFDMTTTFVMPKSDVTLKAVFGENPTEFSYTVADEKAVITGYTGTGGEIEIPARIGGYWVTAIGDWTFLDCSSLTRVEIPDCVKRIGDSAFSNCTNMSEVYIGSGVETVGRFPFNRCYALTDINVSEDNANYCSEDGILYNKDKTELVAYPPGRVGQFSIPQGVTSIAPTAFGNCGLLTGINIPESVRSIGQDAFTNTNIVSVTIPDNVESIEDYTFYRCLSLQNVTFGKNVKSIGENAFYGCGKLIRLYFPETLTAIKSKAFAYCSQLTHVYFWGSRPETLADNAFESCSSCQIYYHVSKAGSWAAVRGKAFCILTLEQGGDLGRVTQNAVLDGFKLIKPADPKREDYAFAGWYTDTECKEPYDFDNTVTVDITLYAKWTPLKFSITYNLDGGSLSTPNPSYYRTNGAAITLRNPVRTGYTFAGWSGTGISGILETVTIPSGSTGDRYYVANWTPNTYAITFNSKEGSDVPPVNAQYGSLITEPAAPTRPGYSFAGWYMESSCINRWDFSTETVTKDDTLYAKWDPRKFSISYDLGGGSLNTPNPEYYMTDGGVITLHNPIKTGHTFSGWSGTGISGVLATVTIPSGSTGDRNYAAHWTPNTYTVTFNSKEGSGITAVNSQYGSLIPEPAPPSRPGYSFAGWYKEASCISRWNFQTDTVTGSDTLYAKWQPFSCLLDHVELSAGTLMKPFAKSTASYNITLGEYEESITLTLVKEYDGALMKINNAVRNSITLNVAGGKSVTVKVSVTFNKKTKNYTFKITRMKTSNNALSALYATAGSFDKPFDPNVLSYTLNLNENTKSVTIKAASASGAGVSPSSKTLTLNNGAAKTVNVTVKAQTGAKRTYTITVIRASASNADLKMLKAPGLSPGFSPGTTNYTVMLPASKSSLSISAKAAGYKAAIFIDGIKKSSKKVTVSSGQSVTVCVTVAAQAGNTKDYYITVTRPLA